MPFVALSDAEIAALTPEEKANYEEALSAYKDRERFVDAIEAQAKIVFLEVKAQKPEINTVQAPEMREYTVPDMPVQTVSIGDVTIVAVPELNSITEPEIQTEGKNEAAVVSVPTVNKISAPDYFVQKTTWDVSVPELHEVLAPEIKIDGEEALKAAEVGVPVVQMIEAPETARVMVTDVKVSEMPVVHEASAPDMSSVKITGVRISEIPDVRSVTAPAVSMIVPDAATVPGVPEVSSSSAVKISIEKVEVNVCTVSKVRENVRPDALVKPELAPVAVPDMPVIKPSLDIKVDIKLPEAVKIIELPAPPVVPLIDEQERDIEEPGYPEFPGIPFDKIDMAVEKLKSSFGV